MDIYEYLTVLRESQRALNPPIVGSRDAEAPRRFERDVSRTPRRFERDEESPRRGPGRGDSDRGRILEEKCEVCKDPVRIREETLARLREQGKGPTHVRCRNKRYTKRGGPSSEAQGYLDLAKEAGGETGSLVAKAQEAMAGALKGQE